jgi:imidazolonepropionase-like amidohydrolase
MIQLMHLADEFGFKIATFQHALEAYKVADEIAAHGIGAGMFSDWWGGKAEAADGIPYGPALTASRGVLVSLNSDDPGGGSMLRLNEDAAKSMKWGGISEEAAIKMITINPAKQLGIADRVGSIEVGKDADIVVYQNYPLSSYARVETTFIDGRIYFDRTLELERRKKLAAEKRALLERQGWNTVTAASSAGGEH